MEPWQQRIVDEKNLLDVKIDALSRWLKNPPVPDKLIEAVDISLLNIQLMTMLSYSAVLATRISRFK
jgi:hypothetical protein